jgi:hypothetical protein
MDGEIQKTAKADEMENEMLNVSRIQTERSA